LVQIRYDRAGRALVYNPETGLTAPVPTTEQCRARHSSSR
jgi:hypothetical protein